MPSLEEPTFTIEDSVMYLGVSPGEKIDPQLRKQISPQKEILKQLLGDTHATFVETGIGQKAVDLARAKSVYDERSVDIDKGVTLADAYKEHDLDPVRLRAATALRTASTVYRRMESEDFSEDEPLDGDKVGEVDDEVYNPLEDLILHIPKIDESARYEVAKNVEEDDPYDPNLSESTLYIVIRTGPGTEDFILVEVGSQTHGQDGADDTFIPKTPYAPPELWLAEQELKVVGSQADIFEREMTTGGRLPDLGTGGFYNNLVAEAPEAEELEAEEPIDAS